VKRRWLKYAVALPQSIERFDDGNDTCNSVASASNYPEH